MELEYLLMFYINGLAQACPTLLLKRVQLQLQDI